MAFRSEKAVRIASRKYSTSDRTGAAGFEARGNSRGRRIIYTADSFAGVMLEKAMREKWLLRAHKFKRTVPKCRADYEEYLRATAMLRKSLAKSDSTEVERATRLEVIRFDLEPVRSS